MKTHSSLKDQSNVYETRRRHGVRNRPVQLSPNKTSLGFLSSINLPEEIYMYDDAESVRYCLLNSAPPISSIEYTKLGDVGVIENSDMKWSKASPFAAPYVSKISMIAPTSSNAYILFSSGLFTYSRKSKAVFESVKRYNRKNTNMRQSSSFNFH